MIKNEKLPEDDELDRLLAEELAREDDRSAIPSGCLPRTQPDVVDEDLYVLPEVCREAAKGAVRAGLARGPQEFWTYTVGPEAPGANEGPTALELIVAGIVRAHPSHKDDVRTDQQRFVQAMNALLGQHYRSRQNDRDDRELLAHMAWSAELAHQDGKAPQHRKFARMALSEIEGPQSVNESAIRRLAAKFDHNPDVAREYAEAPDGFRLMVEAPVIREIAALFRSVGTQVKLHDLGRDHLSM